MLFLKIKKTIKIKAYSPILILSLFSTLTACGGGGGGGGGSSSQSSGSQPPGGAASAPAYTPLLPGNNAAILQCPVTGSPFSVTSPPDPLAGSVVGRVSFDRVMYSTNIGDGLDYGNQQELPARGIVVEALASSDGNQCDGAVVATTITDSDGWYQLTPAGSTNICVRARAQLYRFGTPGWNFAVADNTNANEFYTMSEVNAASTIDRPRRDLHAASGWSNGDYSDARTAAPFAILDTACKALNEVLKFRPAAQLGDLSFYWSTSNTEDSHLSLQQGNIGSTHFDSQTVAIYLRGDADVNTDEFDEMVIAHEFGHFVTHHFSRSDSIGGAHNLMGIVDPRIAFDEGWATAFAGLVLQTPIYRDSMGDGQEFHFDMQNPNIDYAKGWYAESSVQRILFNIGADNSQFGGLGIGVDGLLQTLAGDYKTTPALASIFSYTSQLMNEHNTLANSIADIVDDEEINGHDIQPFAENETHSLTASDLPVYGNIGVVGQGGHTKLICSSNNYDSSLHKNALSIRRYLKLSVPGSGNYRFDIQPQNSDGIAGIELLNRGVSLAYLRANSANTLLSITRSLAAGTYVLGVFHNGFLDVADNSSFNPQIQCFKVTVTLQ